MSPRATAPMGRERGCGLFRGSAATADGVGQYGDPLAEAKSEIS